MHLVSTTASFYRNDAEESVHVRNVEARVIYVRRRMAALLRCPRCWYLMSQCRFGLLVVVIYKADDACVLACLGRLMSCSLAFVHLATVAFSA